MQEIGRSDRDDKPCIAILYRGVRGSHANTKVKNCLANTQICWRKLLFQDFVIFRGTLRVYVVVVVAMSVVNYVCDCSNCV